MLLGTLDAQHAVIKLTNCLLRLKDLPFIQSTQLNNGDHVIPGVVYAQLFL